MLVFYLFRKETVEKDHLQKRLEVLVLTSRTPTQLKLGRILPGQGLSHHKGSLLKFANYLYIEFALVV